MSKTCKYCVYFDRKSKSRFCGTIETKECTGGFYGGSFVDPNARCCPDFVSIQIPIDQPTISQQVQEIRKGEKMCKRICERCKSAKVAEMGSYGGTTYYICEKCHDWGEKNKFPEATLFDHITQSPEVLAPKLVYYENGTGYYNSTIVFYKEYPNCPIDFNTETEAIAATVAKLHEVEK